MCIRDSRKTARELEEEVSYDANDLNQYVDIAGGEDHFKPVYDADGNQATIRTCLLYTSRCV